MVCARAPVPGLVCLFVCVRVTRVGKRGDGLVLASRTNLDELGGEQAQRRLETAL